MVAAFLEVVISFMPSKMRQKMFPPVVTGVAIMLIGASLIGGGHQVRWRRRVLRRERPRCSAAFGGPQLCNENGNVMLPFPEYVGVQCRPEYAIASGEASARAIEIVAQASSS